MSTFQVHVSFPDRLRISEFTSVSEALVEFVDAQKLTVGAASAIVQQVDEHGVRHPVARWESPLHV